MKINVNRLAFVSALGLLSSVVSKRSPKPALACVKLTAKDGSLTLVGADLELAAEIIFGEVQIEQEGSLLANLNELQTTLKSSDSPTMAAELQTVDGEPVLRLSDDDSEFFLPTLPVAEFPLLPIATDPVQCEGFFIASQALIDAINHVEWSADNSNGGRYAYDFFCFSFPRGKVEIAATNSRTLAISEVAVTPTGGDADHLVHARVGPILAKIVKYVDDSADHFSVQFVRTDLAGVACFSSGFVKLLVQLPDPANQKFPPYRDIVQGVEPLFQFSGVTESFAAALKKAAMPLRFGRENSLAVVLELAPDSGVTLSVNAGGRSSRVQYPCRTVGGSVRFGVNPDYITDAIQAGGTEEFTVSGSAPNRPWMVSNGNGYKAVIMPINIAEEKPAAAERPQAQPTDAAASAA